MSFYYDTSVSVALEVGEAGAAALVEWRDERDFSKSLYSDFGRAELAAAIAGLVRMGEAAPTSIKAALRHLDDAAPDWAIITVEPADIAQASLFVMHYDLGLRLPDAIHLAVASRLGAALVTLGKKQHRAAVALGIPVAGPLVDS